MHPSSAACDDPPAAVTRIAQTHCRSCSVVELAEILGNKWFMLGDDDRREPRDLYDVWAGLIRFEVPFSELARGHRAKYGFGPQEGQLTRALRLQALWEMPWHTNLRSCPASRMPTRRSRSASRNGRC
jgi:hypothetical protein